MLDIPVVSCQGTTQPLDNFSAGPQGRAVEADVLAFSEALRIYGELQLPWAFHGGPVPELSLLRQWWVAGFRQVLRHSLQLGKGTEHPKSIFGTLPHGHLATPMM